MTESYSSLTTVTSVNDVYFDAADAAAQQSSTADRTALLASAPPGHQPKPSDHHLLSGRPISRLPTAPQLSLSLDNACCNSSDVTLDAYASGMATILTDASLPVPLVMGLHGPPSSGKTHLIKMMLWKMKGICSFSCSNMSSPVTPKPVRWRYNLCGSRCCQLSFFCYLGLLAASFFLFVGAVVGFTIWASRTYPAAVVAINESLAIAPSTVLPDPFQDNSLVYPLIAAGALVGVCLFFAFIFVLVYCCRNMTGRHSSEGFWHHVRIILVMLLCDTPPPPQLQKHEHAEIIPVAFNACEYAGSNVLWAGIVTSLLDQIEQVFGNWKVRVYRLFVTHTVSHFHDKRVALDDGGEESEGYHYHIGDSLYSGEKTSTTGALKRTSDGNRATGLSRYVVVHSAKWAHVPYPVLVTIVSAVASMSILVVILFAVKAGSAELVKIEYYIQIGAGALFGVTVLSQVQNMWSIGKVLVSSQSNLINKAVQQSISPDFSSDLGIMHRVHSEISKVTDFLKLMERLYQKKFRVLILVDALDRCEPAKIVNIIETVNTLLSDEESHFVTMLAVDHNAVNAAFQGKTKGSARYMQQLVQMRFCMPEYSRTDITRALGKNTGCSVNCDESLRTERASILKANSKAGSCQCARKDHKDMLSMEDLEMAPLTSIGGKEPLRQKLWRRMTKLAVNTLTDSSRLLPASYKDVRDLHNMLFFSLYLWMSRVDLPPWSDLEIVDSLQEKLSPVCQYFTAWIFLAEEWPYRCSWILYHIGEMEELALKASPDLPRGLASNITLADVYQHVHKSLKALEDWKYWISNDGDPDIFDAVLRQFPLTVNLVKQFLPFTINLDRGIKQAILEHCNMHEDASCTVCEEKQTRPSND